MIYAQILGLTALAVLSLALLVGGGVVLALSAVDQDPAEGVWRGIRILIAGTITTAGLVALVMKLSGAIP